MRRACCDAQDHETEAEYLACNQCHPPDLPGWPVMLTILVGLLGTLGLMGWAALGILRALYEVCLPCRQ